MDFDFELSQLKNKITETNNAFKDFQKKYMESLKKTNVFLNCCKEVGIKKVSVGKNCKSISSCKDWPFSFEGNLFATKKDKYGDSLIWKVAELTGLNPKCGNGGQVQADTNYLIDGIYEYRKGKWIRREK